RTKVYVKKECPQDCVITSNFNIKRRGFRGKYDLINTSTSSGFTSIVGYEWYIDGRLISTQKDIIDVRLKGKKVCLRVYGINKTGDCCFDEQCKNLKANNIFEGADHHQQAKIKSTATFQ
ncbi:MAG: hypothetical protein ACPGU0_02375, partial [Marinirhabdus sp.]